MEKLANEDAETLWTVVAEPAMLKLSEYDFALSPDAVAQHPMSPRDSSRLLEARKTATGAHLRSLHFRDLPDLLEPGDLLVRNDAKVIPGRLKGTRPDGKTVMITLTERKTEHLWFALAKPLRRLREGMRIRFAQDFAACVQDRADGRILLAFETTNFRAQLHRYGGMPLPPYIRRRDFSAVDRRSYQTCFAERSGAVAAPTAGLHFTPRLDTVLHARGVGIATLTLLLGPSSFLPLREGPQVQPPPPEYCELSAECVTRIQETKSRNRKVVAVGTTSLRLLESAALQGTLKPFSGPTDLFIRPGFRFRVVDRLLTNFHLPRSSHLVLVSTFAGCSVVRAAYEYAANNQYRFYSYGDACLLDRCGVAVS